MSKQTLLEETVNGRLSNEDKNKSVIATLEQILAEAKKGLIHEFAFTGLNLNAKDGENNTYTSLVAEGPLNTGMASALEALRDEFIHQIFAPPGILEQIQAKVAQRAAMVVPGSEAVN